MEQATINKLGDYLKMTRNVRGLSLKEVSEEIGVSASYINRIENGSRNNPSIFTLDKLSKFYKITTNEVMALAGYDVNEEITPESQELIFFLDKSDYITINGKKVSSKIVKSVLEEMLVVDINKLSNAVRFCKKIGTLQKSLHE